MDRTSEVLVQAFAISEMSVGSRVDLLGVVPNTRLLSKTAMRQPFAARKAETVWQESGCQSCH